MNNSMYTHDFKTSTENTNNNNIKSEPGYSTINPLSTGYPPAFGYLPYLNNPLHLPWQLDYPWMYPTFRHPVGNVQPSAAMSLFSENAIHETLGYPAYNYPVPSTCVNPSPTWHLIKGANDQVYMVPDMPTNIPCPAVSCSEISKTEALNNSGSIASPNPKLAETLISPSNTPQPPKAHSAPYSPATYSNIPKEVPSSPSMKQNKPILPSTSSPVPNGSINQIIKRSQYSTDSKSESDKPTRSDNPQFNQGSLPPAHMDIHTTSSKVSKYKDNSTQTKSCLCEPCLERQRSKIRPLSPIITEQSNCGNSNLYHQIQEAKTTNQFAFSAPPSALASPYNQDNTNCTSVPKRHPSADSAMIARSIIPSSLGDLALIARYFENVDQVKALEDDLAELHQEWQARASPSAISNNVGRLEIPWDTEQPSFPESNSKPCFSDLGKFSGDELNQLDRSRELLEKIKTLKKQLTRLNKEHPELAKLESKRSNRPTKKLTYLSPKHCALSLLSFCAVEQQDRLLSLNNLLKLDKISPLSPISLAELKHDSPSVASTASPSPVRTKVQKSKRRASTDLSPSLTPKVKKRPICNVCSNKSVTSNSCSCSFKKSTTSKENPNLIREVMVQNSTEPTISSKCLSSVSPSFPSFSTVNNNDKSQMLASLKQVIKANINSPIASPSLSESSFKKSNFQEFRTNPVIKKNRIKSGDSTKYGKAPTLLAADIDRRPNSDIDSGDLTCPVLFTPYEPLSQPQPSQFKNMSIDNAVSADTSRKCCSPRSAKSPLSICKILKKEFIEISNPDLEERPSEEMRPPTPDIRKSDLELSDLSDGLRILLVQNTHLRAGSLSLYSSGNTTNTANNTSGGQSCHSESSASGPGSCSGTLSGGNQADAAQLVYSVRLDGDRRQQESLLLGWQVLGQAVMEVVPSSIKHLPPRTRVCAYWSDQLASNLYPGTVEESEEDDEIESNCVLINFDDGDRKQILLDRIRILPENFGNLSDLAPSIEIEMGTRRKSRANSAVQDSQPCSSAQSRSCGQQQSAMDSTIGSDYPLTIDIATTDPTASSVSMGVPVSHPNQWNMESPGLHTPISSAFSFKDSLSKSASPAPMRFNSPFFQDQFRSRLSNVQSPSSRFSSSGLSPQNLESFEKKKRFFNTTNKFKKEFKEKRSLSQPSMSDTLKNRKLLTKAQLKQRAEQCKASPRGVSPKKKRGVKRKNVVTWTFQGKPIRKRNSRNSYKEIIRDLDKHSVQVGDSVEFSSGEAGNTYLGHVRDIYFDMTTQSMMISAAWYYYPDEAGTDGQKVVHLRDAVFISEHVDPNEVRCIIRKANVQPNYAAFKAFMEKSTNDMRRSRLSKKEADSSKTIEERKSPSDNERTEILDQSPIIKKKIDRSDLFGDISSLSSIMSSTTSSEAEENSDDDVADKSVNKSNSFLSNMEEKSSTEENQTDNHKKESRKQSASSDSESDDEEKEKVFFVAGRFDPKNNRVYEWDPDLAETLGITNK